MQYSEDKIQQEIVLWFKNNYCLKHHNPRYCIFSVPNGGTRNKLEAIRLKSTGLLAGVSDLIVLYDKLYFIEVKTDKGRQSDKQKDFEKVVSSLGYEYKLVRSLDDFKRIIE